MKANNETPEQGQNVATDNKRIVIVKAGNAFPNLESQIDSASAGIEQTNEAILREVNDLFTLDDDCIVEHAIHSIYSLIAEERANLRELDDDMPRENFDAISDDLFDLKHMAVCLFHINSLCKQRTEYSKQVELAEHGVLL